MTDSAGTYSVTLGGDLPVSAYIWLKNNQVQYEVLYGWADNFESTSTMTLMFKNKEDAAWFALKWSS